MSCKKISINNYEIISCIGEGAVSKVYLVQDKQSKQRFALKKICKQNVEVQNILYQVYIEKLIISNLQSDYLLKLYGTSQDKNFLYFLTEYAEYGTLHDFILHNEDLQIEAIKYIAKEILNMLQFLRQNGIIHRDLKPCNILIDRNYKFKLIDFGTCKIIKQSNNQQLYEKYLEIKQTYKENSQKDLSQQNLLDLPSFVGTANYVAPEVLDGNEHSFGTDIWSFGVILYMLFVKRFPFQGQNAYHIFQQIQKAQTIYPKDLDVSVKDILQKIFIQDPYRRLGNGPQQENLDFISLIQNSFFQDNKNGYEVFKSLQYFIFDKQNDNRNTEDTDHYEQKAFIISKGLVKKYKYWYFYDTRQIILYSNKIMEYKNPYNGKLKGRINLKNCKITQLNEYDFTIKTKERTYYFRSLNEFSDYWVSIISKINNQQQCKIHINNFKIIHSKKKYKPLVNYYKNTQDVYLQQFIQKMIQQVNNQVQLNSLYKKTKV